MTEKRHIYLIGFSGSGKSTIGPKLAKRMRFPFVDIDKVIERESGLTVPEFFKIRGERHFRRLESVAISRQAGISRPRVIALGGGGYSSAINRKVVDRSGITIYLRCSTAEIYRRLKDKNDRPLLAGTRQEKLERIGELLSRRQATYRKAEITISTTDRTPAETVRLIEQRLKERDGNR